MNLALDSFLLFLVSLVRALGMTLLYLSISCRGNRVPLVPFPKHLECADHRPLFSKAPWLSYQG
uniref:Uncharacterized protein n=1 Tax=Picea glauca TaxID=3330 RepID=A0A124GMI6_PICGL|nr:hypothetical protein ABT39_MTgene2349 [Picea glauca]QHR92275.1 hypothetical protein Q903MT_gene6316 [Picea sitchensis]